MAKLIKLFSLLVAMTFAFSLTACNEEKDGADQTSVEDVSADEEIDASDPSNMADEPRPVMGEMRTAGPVAEEPEEDEEKEEKAPRTRDDEDHSLPPIEHN